MVVVHIDSSAVRSAEGKRHLFLPIDRVTKFAYAEYHPRTTMAAGASFLQGVIHAYPYAIHTVLTDNGTAFIDQPRYRNGPTALLGGHPFRRVCRANGITHKRTKPSHPWTNGQVERMNRTSKEATVKASHYATHGDLESHVRAFVTAYTFAKHVKALRWRAPYQAVCDAWADEPQLFRINPHHLIPRPNTQQPSPRRLRSSTKRTQVPSAPMT